MPRLAILIDAENLTVEHFPTIDAKVRALGDPIIFRLFGDFTKGRQPAWLELARQRGLEPMMQLNGGRGKNSTDIAMTINAMDVLHSGAAEGFVLASTDRDFLPLATRLRAAGRRVYGFAVGPIEPRFKSVFSDVFELSLPKAGGEVAPSPKGQSIIDAFREITANHGGEMTLAAFGAALRKHAPDVAPTTGKGKLRKLLQETGAFVESGTGTGIKIRLNSG